MEKGLTNYIWTHTRRQQLWILLIVALSMIPYFMSFDLPKQIVNGPIQGQGFEGEAARQIFMRVEFALPFFGNVVFFPGIELNRLQMLMALSLVFLALVVVNGLFKLYINTYKGRLGERLLRRIRFELVDRVLRFPPTKFKRMKGAEIASMVKDEVEPLGGFTGDAFVAGFLYGQIHGHSPQKSLAYGAAMGASCVRSLGATTGVFCAEELEAFVEAHPLSVEG